MSFTISLSEKSSEISEQYYPPIDLHGKKYQVALIGLSFWNSIPNVTLDNNALEVVHEKYGIRLIELRKGSYDIDDIEKSLNQILKEKIPEATEDMTVKIESDTTIMSANITSNEMVISFNVPNSIGPLLGHSKKRTIPPRKMVESDSPVQINDNNVIRVLCNLVGNSFENDRISTIIHEIYDLCEPGHRFAAEITNPIYYPLNVDEIGDLTCKLVNNNNKLIDLNGEVLSLRLHFQPIP